MAAQQDEIEITVFTDPLCCWSWAFEAQLENLRDNYAGRISLTYIMGGLIPSWDNFHDSVNSISRPAQMGPLWMQAGQIAGKAIAHHIWIKDPPASSYPACIAVKCAQLQSAKIGEVMLYKLREACMGSGRNIAKDTVLMEIAEELAKTHEEFNLPEFILHFKGDDGIAAFKEDLQTVSFHRINRFPTIIIRMPERRSLLLDGYRNFEEIHQAIKKQQGTPQL